MQNVTEGVLDLAAGHSPRANYERISGAQFLL